MMRDGVDQAAVPARIPLSRDRVLRAAVAFADEHGIASLSMRKLGEALGVEAMSLYNHVANKDELLDGMVDLVFGEIELPAGDGDWRTAMRQRAVSARQVLSRHRWAIGLMESRTSPGPATLRHHDARDREPSERRLLGRDGRPRLLACSTATSTASRCRRRACRSTPGRRPPSWPQAIMAAVPAGRVPPPHRADRRARPAAGLRLRQRVRVRPRPDPRRPRAGRVNCRRRRHHDRSGVARAGQLGVLDERSVVDLAVCRPRQRTSMRSWTCSSPVGAISQGDRGWGIDALVGRSRAKQRDIDLAAGARR